MSEKGIIYRAAVFGGAEGIVPDTSEKEKLIGAAITTEGKKTTVTGGTVVCEEGNLNAFILRDGAWRIRDTSVQLSGEIGNDLEGLGAGMLIEGETDAVLENVDIAMEGASRTTVLVRGNAHLLAKDSRFTTRDGALAEDYVGTVFPAKMKSSPWMLGVNGNARGTNLMGHAQATYFQSRIRAEKWGALSTDDNTGVFLWVINSDVEVYGGAKERAEVEALAESGSFDFYHAALEHEFPAGEWQDDRRPSGYGAYSIGPTLVTIAGSAMLVPDYIAIVANGPSSLHLTSSEPAAIAAAWGYRDIADALVPRASRLYSRRFGVMFHSCDGTGTVTVDRGTKLYTGKAAFLVKGCPGILNVDRAEIATGDGTILQVMDNDDAGVDTQTLETVKDYVEKHVPGTATEERTNAPAVPRDSAFLATFANMTLKGNIYNASGWEAPREADILAGMDAYDNEVGGGASAATDLKLVLHSVDYTGTVSTAEAFHQKQVIGHLDYPMIGDVRNEVRLPENAGISVALRAGTVWKVTGRGYITSLTVDGSSRLEGAKVFVNGVETAVESGRTYTGVVRVEPLN